MASPDPLASRAPEPRCLTPTEIQGLVNRSLLPAEGVRLTEHLAACARCRDEVDDRLEFEELRRGYRAAERPPPPEVPLHRVEELVGGGGQGWVWCGRNVPLNQRRAFKSLRGEDLSAEARGRLVAEARVMAELPPHPNRVQVFELHDRPEGPVLVMAYFAGGSLSRVVPLPWERALRYVTGAAEGLREVHARGYVHRDIKVLNLLLDAERDEAVLGDYGLACPPDGGVGPTGTPGYLAPELLSGPPSVKSDVFALAATLYHLLVGAPPFDARNPYASLRQAREGLPRRAPELDRLPRGVAAVIRAGLEPDPARRAGLGQFLALLKAAPVAELAEEVRRLARRSACPVRLDVTFSASAPPPSLDFRPVLSSSSRQQVGGATPALEVRGGDLLRVEATAEEDGFWTVLDFDSAGGLNVLPPPGESDLLRADPAFRLTVQMKPSPAGDHLAVLWTRRPLRLSPEVWRERILAGRLTTPERGAVYLECGNGRRPADDWAAVVVFVSQPGAASR
jgi:serine/threonine protein kinase